MNAERVAIVTGGGAGLGRELTFGLAAAGFAVVVADVDGDAAEATALEIKQEADATARETRQNADATALEGRREAEAAGHESGQKAGQVAVAVRADVRDPAQARHVVRAATELGALGVLVNNAGGWTRGDRQFPHADPEDWAATLALNLTAPMLLTQLVLEPMRAAGGGAVVNIASSAARGDDAYGSPEYAATKAGLIRLTSSLRGLGDTHGVRAMCLVPGWIGLDRAHAQLAAMSPADRAAASPLIPPSEVVTAALDLIASGQPGAVVDLPQ